MEKLGPHDATDTKPSGYRVSLPTFGKLGYCLPYIIFAFCPLSGFMGEIRRLGSARAGGGQYASTPSIFDRDMTA
jgi:hypothetical protein